MIIYQPKQQDNSKGVDEWFRVMEIELFTPK